MARSSKHSKSATPTPTRDQGSNPDPVLKVKQAAEYLNISESHLRRMVHAGQLENVKFETQLGVRRSVLDQLLGATTPRTPELAGPELNADPLLNRTQAAAYLNIGPRTLSRLISHRQVSITDICGAERVRRSECERLIRECTIVAIRPIRNARY